MFESSEIFTAYATISACYYGIGEIEKEVMKMKSRPPIVQMVDEATGYYDAKQKQFTEDTIELLNVIIENKKIIEDDYTAEKDLIGELIKLL